jgi:cell division protein FtsN
VATASGPWRVQLGAFAVRGNADRLWARLSGRSELAGRSKLAIRAGAVTKLQAAGYPSRDTAEAACRSLKRAGQECLVTR